MLKLEFFVQKDPLRDVKNASKLGIFMRSLLHLDFDGHFQVNASDFHAP